MRKEKQRREEVMQKNRTSENRNSKQRIFRWKKRTAAVSKLVAAAAVLTICFSLSGCAWISNRISEFKGSLIGNSYTIDTFDNFGKKVMETSGKKISVNGNYTNSADSEENRTLTSVITINVDGNQIISSGDTLVFYETGLEPEYDWSIREIESTSNPLDPTDNTLIAGQVNAVKNVFGKSEVIVIKSQTGAPIYAFSGDRVYWEIPDDLPKFTRINVDGKQLYIHRANFQIIDKALLK